MSRHTRSLSPPRISRSQADTVLFWWYATIIAHDGPDRLILGKLLLQEQPQRRGAKPLPIPQRPQDLPHADRCYYPVVYLPITYGDLTLFAQSRGEELGAENIQKRGALVAEVRIAAANHYLNWNQTEKQRIKQLARLGIVALPPNADGYSKPTSPLFGDPPAIKYRQPLSGHSKGIKRPTLDNVIRREQARLQRRELPVHDELAIDTPHRLIRHRHRLPPTPILSGHNTADHEYQDDIITNFSIADESGMLPRPQGLSQWPPVDAKFGVPMCCR